MRIQLTALNEINCYNEIDLPLSKSQSNRALIIHYLTESQTELPPLSEAQDTQLLKGALLDLNKLIDVHHAGTAFRFLTALLCIVDGKRILTGSFRLQQRPIGPLVEILRSLGSKIEYIEKEAYPPLLIEGNSNLHGGNISIDSSISSQFISALMMIGPKLKNGLTIHLLGKTVSSPYINLTAQMMKKSGASVNLQDKLITISPISYKQNKFHIESDYAAASYWYSLLVFLPEGTEIFMQGLGKDSFQADKNVIEIYAELGIKSDFVNDRLLISKIKNFVPNNNLKFDMNDSPDLAQTLVCTCAGLGINLQLTGLSTLKLKESDRRLALKTELIKFGIFVDLNVEDSLMLRGKFIKNKDAIINTYNDHRMAMSFAPLMICNSGIKIDDSQVVEKSYPNFWKEMQKFASIIEFE
ncbi:MAG: 3-phosphoshikimate 1-carboxyvinyltransferase [Saprospiraceae bacterium]